MVRGPVDRPAKGTRWSSCSPRLSCTCVGDDVARAGLDGITSRRAAGRGRRRGRCRPPALELVFDQLDQRVGRSRGAFGITSSASRTPTASAARRAPRGCVGRAGVVVARARRRCRAPRGARPDSGTGSTLRQLERWRRLVDRRAARASSPRRRDRDVVAAARRRRPERRSARAPRAASVGCRPATRRAPRPRPDRDSRSASAWRTPRSPRSHARRSATRCSRSSRCGVEQVRGDRRSGVDPRPRALHASFRYRRQLVDGPAQAGRRAGRSAASRGGRSCSARRRSVRGMYWM